MTLMGGLVSTTGGKDDLQNWISIINKNQDVNY